MQILPVSLVSPLSPTSRRTRFSQKAPAQTRKNRIRQDRVDHAAARFNVGAARLDQIHHAIADNKLGVMAGAQSPCYLLELQIAIASIMAPESG
jgi:hypothetical protein